MKIIFSIISCIIIYMSCIPCGDTKDMPAMEKINITVAQNQEQHPHPSEACTPFCACTCCSVTLIHMPIQKQQAVNVNSNSEKFPLYTVALNTEVCYSIWQPPKSA